MNPKDLDNKNKAVRSLLDMVIESCGLELEYTLTGGLDSSGSETGEDVAGSSARAQEASARKRLSVEFTGPDTPLLTARNGELLNAMEHIAAKVLGLDSEDHDRILFDADAYKLNRELDLHRLGAEGIASVRSTGKPYAFSPMTSRERRMLHLVLSESGLATASSGEGPRRYVVVYPEGYEISAETLSRPDRDGSRPGNVRGAAAVPAEERLHAVRNSFRRR